MEIDFKTELDLAVLQKEVSVSNQEEYTQAGDVLKLCKNKIKEIDEERKKFTKPLDESKKRIMAKAKELIDPIQEYISKIERAMSSWYVVEQKRIAEEQKRLEEEAIKNASEDEPDIEVPVVAEIEKKGNIATTSMIKSYTFEVINLDEVPREFMMLDESKVKQFIKDGSPIKGLKIKEVFKPRSR